VGKLEGRGILALKRRPSTLNCGHFCKGRAYHQKKGRSGSTQVWKGGSYHLVGGGVILEAIRAKWGKGKAESFMGVEEWGGSAWRNAKDSGPEKRAGSSDSEKIWEKLGVSVGEERSRTKRQTKLGDRAAGGMEELGEGIEVERPNAS